MICIARETVMIAGVCLLDLLVTVGLISTGRCTEANPLLAHCLQYGIGALCAAKLASFVIPLTIAEWYRSRHPLFVRWALRAALSLYVLGYVVGITAVNLASF